MRTSRAPSPSSLMAVGLLAVMAVGSFWTAPAHGQFPRIQEIHIDQPSIDLNEHFKIAGVPGTSLDGLTYVVLGDHPGSGVIEEATDLSGHTIPASGLFVVAESTFSLGTADLTTVLDFENSDNVTHLLVSGFTGSSDQDLDPDDDGVLDEIPWTSVVDKIAVIKEENPPVGTEWHYGPPTIGPHGSRSPQHVYRCFGDWRIFDSRPKSGGDDGSVTIRIPLRFEPDMVIRLARDEGWEIPASRVVGDPTDGTCLVLATFDLVNQPLGFWHLVVEYQDGEVFMGPNVFTVVESQPADLWIDVIGRPAIRLGREASYQVLYGSSKDVDFADVLFWIAVPNNVEAAMDLPYLVDVGSGFDDLADPIGGLKYLWFYADQLGPGETRTANLRIRILSPSTIQIHAGIIEGDWIIERTDPAARLHDASPKGSAMRKSLSAGDLVFKSGEPSDPYPAGHVGISYIDGGGSVWVLDFVRDGVCHLSGAFCDGRPRKIPFADWSPGPGTYQGSATPPGISSEQADHAAENANDAYAAWQQSGEPAVPFFLPPRENPVGLLPAARNCVNWVNDQYRAAGYEPPWIGWSSPGMLYAWSTGVLWPQPRYEAFKLFQNFSLQLLSDPAVWQAVEYRTLTTTVTTVASFDPNEKVGSQGSGGLQYLSADEELRYLILFENLETATAPAQEVVITDLLDPDTMDVDTLELLAISFGDTVISLPRGTMSYTGEVRVPGQVLEEIIVRINVSFDPVTSLLTWRLTTIDPATGDPPSDPFEGFLPPNLEPPEGDGSVLFTARPKEGLVTGTEIYNSASIVFDVNPPIDTGEWLNTIDNSAPQSHVVALEAQQCWVSFEVEWMGTDEGAGVRDYTIFVSEDGSTYAPWLVDASDTAGIFAGLAGQSYWFKSTCRDHTGNREEPPLDHDAMTTIAEGHDNDQDQQLSSCDNCPDDPNPDQLDDDGDQVGNVCDLCPGHDDHQDADGDAVPDGCDQCLGNDAAGDGDGDQVCADIDCDDSDPSAAYIDVCGVCGGDDSTCLIFADGFESGETTAWTSASG